MVYTLIARRDTSCKMRSVSHQRETSHLLSVTAWPLHDFLFAVPLGGFPLQKVALCCGQYAAAFAKHAFSVCNTRALCSEKPQMLCAAQDRWFEFSPKCLIRSNWSAGAGGPVLPTILSAQKEGPTSLELLFRCKSFLCRDMQGCMDLPA